MLKVICISAMVGFITFYSYTQRSFSGLVLDRKTKEKLIYCHIINLKTQSIYITNADGEFKINEPDLADSLKISYLGYIDLIISMSTLLRSNIVYLDQDNILMSEVNIKLNDKEILKLIGTAGKKFRRTKSFKSKAYLELYSEDKGDHIELMQSYYNVNCKGAHVSDFAIKAAKIALTANNEKLFVNLGSTFALTRLNPISKSLEYPLNPLNLSKNQLAKKYYIRAISGFDAQSDVAHLAFEPIKLSDTTDYFTGEIWIRKSDQQTMKLKLLSSDAKYHPFKPIRKQDTLKKVAIEMNYYFNDVNTKHRLTLLTFDYGFDYINSESDQFKYRKIHTEGLLHLYDEKELFFIPLLEIDSLYNDYIKASLIPFDSVFWQKTQSVPVTEKQLKRYHLFANNGILLNFEEITKYKSTDNENKTNFSKFFDHNNLIWDSTTVIRLIPQKNDLDRAKLHIQLYLDVNKYNNKFYFTTKTILDVFKTSYSLGDKPEHLVFLNIYFDLAEIIRKNMQSELDALDNIKSVQAIHNKYKIRLSELIDKFKSDLNYGKNIRAFKEWNALIKKELNRDHLGYFILNLSLYD